MIFFQTTIFQCNGGVGMDWYWNAASNTPLTLAASSVTVVIPGTIPTSSSSSGSSTNTDVITVTDISTITDISATFTDSSTIPTIFIIFTGPTVSFLSVRRAIW